MSRVHDALRRAAQAGARGSNSSQPRAPSAVAADNQHSLEDLLSWVKSVPFQPLPEALIIDPLNPHEPPTEEFRTLRTRLNHMQSLQPIHTAVVTSPSPAEGKSFT